MPNKWTFQIKPIAHLVAKYIGDGKGWVDPFAGFNSPAEITNDLNPNAKAKHHLHAKDFVIGLNGQKFKGCVFDPPYSLRQVKECYEEFGHKMSFEDSNYFPNNVKKLIAPKIETGGIAITCGWNTIGFGKELGFRRLEILLVCHGGHHNDTIVTVEKKFRETLFDTELKQSA